MTPSGVDVGRAQPARFRNFGYQRAQPRTRLYKFRQNRFWKHQPVKQLKSPPLQYRIVELRRARDRDFRLCDARQPIIQQIRRHEQGARTGQRTRARQPHRVKLIERVDLHELDARVCEDLFARNQAKAASSMPFVRTSR